MVQSISAVDYLVRMTLDAEGDMDVDLSLFLDIELRKLLNLYDKASECFSEFWGGDCGGVIGISLLFCRVISIGFTNVDFDRCLSEMFISGGISSEYDFGEGGAQQMS